MISYRLKGLINLHIVATAVLLTAYFLGLAAAVPYLRFLRIEPGVNLYLYAVPTAVGMLIGGRFWSAYASRYHAMTWYEAAAITIRQVFVVALLVFGLIWATKDQTLSRLFLGFYLITAGVVLLVINRALPALLARLLFTRGHRLRALFVGRSQSATRLRRWIRQKEHLGIHVVGFVADDMDETKLLVGMPSLGRIGELRQVIDREQIGQVIVLDLPPDSEDLLQVIETCQATGTRLLVYQHLWSKLPVSMVPVIEDDHLFLTVHEEPLEDPLNRALKRIFDVLIALPVVLFILPPLCFAVWIIQAFQAQGPLMFRRARGGQQGRNFDMLKFRSMYVAKHDPKLESRQATAGDPRIYPFGAFLRKTSLDEFPQFLNVLLGNMSIVGPRPHLPEHDLEFSMVAKAYRTRQLVKPGITGWAQVHGLRGEISDPQLLHERVKMDIYYITHWSIWLDLQITAKTLLQVFVPPSSAR